MDLCSGFGFLLALNLDAQLRKLIRQTQQTQQQEKTEHCNYIQGPAHRQRRPRVLRDSMRELGLHAVTSDQS